MPDFKSQMQQALGSGPSSGTTAQNWNPSANGYLGGPTVNPASPASTAPNPYDLGDSFTSSYGGKPTHQIVSQMQAGQDPTPVNNLSVAGQQAPVTEVKKPTATPEQAGAMNAASPGIFNGNPANGVPSADEGFSAALAAGPPTPADPPKFYDQNDGTGNEEALKHRAALAGMEVPKPEQPPVATPPVAPPAGSQSPMLAGSSAKPASTGRAATSGVSPAYDPNPVTPTATTPTTTAAPAGQSLALVGGPTNGKAGGQTGAQTPTTTTYPTDAAGSGIGAGKMVSEAPLGATDAGQSGAGANWGQGSYDDIQNAIFGSGSSNWTKNFYSSGLGLSEGEVNRITNNGKDKLKNPNQLGPMRLIRVEGATLPDTFYDPKNAQGVQDDGVRALAVYTETQVAKLLQARSNPDLSTAQRQGIEASLTKKIRTATTALSAYNVFWDPLQSVSAGGDDVESAGGTQGYTDESGQYHLSTSEANYSNPSTWSSGMKNFLVGTNSGKLEPSERLAIMEFMANQGQTNRGMEQQDVAYQGQSQALKDNLADPSLARYDSIAKSIADNPDPTDWEQVSNLETANLDRGVRQTGKQVAESFNRRGLGPSAGAGVMANILREGANDKALALGQIAVDKSRSKREGEMNAAGLLQSGAQMRTGLRSTGEAAKSSVLMGEAPKGESGMDGAANVGLGFQGADLSLEQLKLAQDQADAAGDFTLKDGIGLIASLFGSSLGA